MKDFIMQIWPDLTVSREIGRGPFSTVYEAVPKSGDGLFEAIKVISFKGSVQVMEAIAADLRFMKHLSAANAVVDMKDFKVFEHGDGAGFDIYVRMEKLTPLSLMVGKRTFSESDVVKIAQDVLDDLKMIDDQKMAHLNIKPSNIFLDGAGHYKLADLCTSRRLEACMGVAPVVETQSYMAPEMLAGKSSDIRADIYALGRILNEIMPASASEELKQMVDSACDPDPESRFMKPAAMRNALSFLKLEGSKTSGQSAQMHASMMQQGRQAEQQAKPVSPAGGEKNPAQPHHIGGQTPPGQAKQRAGGPNTAHPPQKKGSKAPIFIGIAAAVIVLIIVAVIAFGGKKDDDTGTEREAIVASEAVDENGQGSEQETESDTLETKTESDTKSAETAHETKGTATGTGGSQSQTGATYVDFFYQTENGEEYADLVGSNDEGVVWTYTTGRYAQAQCKRVSEIGNFDHNGGVFYMVEDGTVLCFDIATGAIRWKNSEFGGVITENSYTFDTNGNLYICGYMSPHLFIVSEKTGETVKRFEKAMDNYYRPYKIEICSINPNYFEITFEQGPNGENVILYYSISDGTFSTSIDGSGNTTSSADTGSSSQNSGKEIDNSVIRSVSASSYLDEPQYGLTHNANCLIDGSTSSVWCEDVSGNGEGEWVKFDLSGRCMVSGFTIYNGHQQDSDLYQKNSRVRKVTVTFSDGTEQTYELADKLGKQGFNFDKPVDTDSVKFTIVSVYEGYKYEDTCISEISLKGTVK